MGCEDVCSTDRLEVDRARWENMPLSFTSALSSLFYSLALGTVGIGLVHVLLGRLK